MSSSRFSRPAGRPALADATKSREAFVLAAIRRWKRIQRIVGLLHGYCVFSAHQRKEQSRPRFAHTHTPKRGPRRILFSKEALGILGISRDPGYFTNNQVKSCEPSEWSLHPSPSSSMDHPWINKRSIDQLFKPFSATCLGRGLVFQP